MSGLIIRTLRIIAAHPNTAALANERVDPKTGTWEVEVAVRLGLPNAWIAVGHSPNGVRAIEPVNFRFPAAFPLKAPTIHLRADFGRSLAHVQPGAPNEPPELCIFDGNVTELLQQQGLAGILNQLVLWLENAALGRLIDPAQGWEPVRRDELLDFIVADAGALRALVSRDEGYAAFGFKYVLLAHGDGRSTLHGAVEQTRLTLNPKTTGKLFGERFSPGTLSLGHSLAIVAWPGRQPSGQLVVDGRYQPETVTDLGTLIARAANFGCATPLRAALRRLETCLAGYQAGGAFPIVVILCARRPYHMIGSDSVIEMCPYILEICAPTLLPVGDCTPVRPAGHRHTITAALLRRMSGGNSVPEPPKWIQLGGGSLGSKIALHMARAGRAPSTVIDRAYLSPHNAARHALLPTPGRMQIPWIGSKATAVAQAIKGLGQHAEAITADIVVITRDKAEAQRLLPKKAWSILAQRLVIAAVQRHDTPVIFGWLIDALSYQGVSDSIAYGYMEQHGRVRWHEIADALEHKPSCSKLGCYWAFEGCGYRKGSGACAYPEHQPGCPLPQHDLRNGRV